MSRSESLSECSIKIWSLYESVLYFYSHALLTINAINYVPRFTVHVYGHVIVWDYSEHAVVEHGGLNFCFTFGVELYEPLRLT